MARKVGRTLTVLVDEVGEAGAVARSAADAPEIDGQVYVPEAGDMRPGELYEVRVVEAGEHDLWAERVEVRAAGGEESARGAPPTAIVPCGHSPQGSA
jgi:ribosomal protein S12 methylthiotransferase